MTYEEYLSLQSDEERKAETAMELYAESAWLLRSEYSSEALEEMERDDAAGRS